MFIFPRSVTAPLSALALLLVLQFLWRWLEAHRDFIPAVFVVQ